ncbi:Uncharacterised protein [Arthrobacter agilis]|uniref:hypothetical protein n=2 Tax=Arthrobacter agilis TaxID=37921 RepID=UPI000B357697|nr:hypothetical protein [Arthrobacter agilis]OUM44471.1 hypothetical protein B8W74_03130 [Arthrobacter agilis]VDR32088.1 Uncharacterised protein [Arthrobacter agilis]
MLWWMWIVLWVAVVAVSAIFLVVVGYRVFRRGMRTLGEFGEAMDRLEVNVPPSAGAARTPSTLTGIPIPAVFSAPEDVRGARELAATRRRDDRRSRRVRTRDRLGQPQLLQDMPHL